jgi:hypothetical protein
LLDSKRRQTHYKAQRTQKNCDLRRPLEVDTWEAAGDRKMIAHRGTEREREYNAFIVLYDVKQLGSGYRSIATEDSCEQ